MNKFFLGIGATLLTGAVVAGVVTASGTINIGADTRHHPLVFKLLETARNRSIAAHQGKPDTPDLDDPKRIAMGASEYGEMCQGCHLGPSVKNSELRQGLYPQPQDLSKRTTQDPARDFWIIKHGVEATGMPAWGVTHDDPTMWAIVAFVRKLPQLTPAQYQILTANASEVHEHEHGDHEHQ